MCFETQSAPDVLVESAISGSLIGFICKCVSGATSACAERHRFWWLRRVPDDPSALSIEFSGETRVRSDAPCGAHAGADRLAVAGLANKIQEKFGKTKTRERK